MQNKIFKITKKDCISLLKIIQSDGMPLSIIFMCRFMKAAGLTFKDFTLWLKMDNKANNMTDRDETKTETELQHCKAVYELSGGEFLFYLAKLFLEEGEKKDGGKE